MRLKSFTAQSDQGPFLQINEDAYDFDLENNLFMVLDGFGGAGSGDIAVNKLKENIKKFYTDISSDPDCTLPFFYSPKYLIEGNALVNAMIYSHNALMRSNASREVATRAGASGLFAALGESILTLSAVGNCTAFLYRKGKFQKIFLEDSFSLLSTDNYDAHLKSMPLSGFGLFPDLYYQVKEVRVASGDLVVLMTDGVYSRVEEDEIKAIVSNPSAIQKEKILELFALSNKRGNLDNQTTMILEF
jgi:serine/threonine protein phosphatase PrpC